MNATEKNQALEPLFERIKKAATDAKIPTVIYVNTGFTDEQETTYAGGILVSVTDEQAQATSSYQMHGLAPIVRGDVRGGPPLMHLLLTVPFEVRSNDGQYEESTIGEYQHTFDLTERFDAEVKPLVDELNALADQLKVDVLTRFEIKRTKESSYTSSSVVRELPMTHWRMMAAIMVCRGASYEQIALMMYHQELKDMTPHGESPVLPDVDSEENKLALERMTSYIRNRGRIASEVEPLVEAIIAAVLKDEDSPKVGEQEQDNVTPTPTPIIH